MKRILVALSAATVFAAGAFGTGNSAFAAKHKAMMTSTVILRPVAGSMVSGTAVFSTDGKMSTVKITVKHLKARSMHPEHIHAGRCGAMGAAGAVKVVLPVLRANNAGIAVATFSWKGNYEHKMWAINVHTGPGLAPASQYKVLTCGNVM